MYNKSIDFTRIDIQYIYNPRIYQIKFYIGKSEITFYVEADKVITFKKIR